MVYILLNLLKIKKTMNGIKKLIFPAALLLWWGFPVIVKAQLWQHAGIPVWVWQVRVMYNDTIDNRLYVGGDITLDGSTNSYLNTLWYYDGNDYTWHNTGDSIVQQILAITRYNNEIYVGGAIFQLNGQPVSGLIKWNGTSWTDVGGNLDGNIWNLKVIGNDLYVMGQYKQIGNISANSIARYDGTNWYDVYNFPGNENSDYCYVNDMAFYNGDLYVGGNFYRYADSLFCLAVYKNNQWQRVGQNNYLRGSFNGVTRLKEYKGELIASGPFLKNEGNVCHNIQKWDGNNWSCLGTGVKDWNNTYNGMTQIHDMIIYKDTIYVLGSFFYAGNVPAKYVARWDGNYWCGLGGNLRMPNTALNFFNDTLYVPVDSIDGVFMNKMAKFLGTGPDTCSVAMSINETQTPQQEINIYPNPNNGNFNVVFSSAYNKAVAISVFNNLGQCVYQKSLNQVDAGSIIHISAEDLARGLYVLRLDSEKQMQTTKFIISK
jgi:hypothetical protein